MAFLSIALGLLRSRLAGPIAAGLCVLLLVFGLSQCSGRVSAERKLAKSEKVVVAVRKDLGTCKANVTTLEASVAAQNAAVDALKREGDLRVAESEKAVRDARVVAASYRKKVEAILAAKPKGGDVCKSADELIAEAVG